jgi:hypothetical protein
VSESAPSSECAVHRGEMLDLHPRQEGCEEFNGLVMVKRSGSVAGCEACERLFCSDLYPLPGRTVLPRIGLSHTVQSLALLPSSAQL